MRRGSANTVLGLSIIGAAGWLGLNLYAGQDVTPSLLLAAIVVGAGLGIGYVVAESD